MKQLKPICVCVTERLTVLPNLLHPTPYAAHRPDPRPLTVPQPFGLRSEMRHGQAQAMFQSQVRVAWCGLLLSCSGLPFRWCMGMGSDRPHVMERGG